MYRSGSVITTTAGLKVEQQCPLFPLHSIYTELQGGIKAQHSHLEEAVWKGLNRHFRPCHFHVPCSTASLSCPPAPWLLPTHLLTSFPIYFLIQIKVLLICFACLFWPPAFLGAWALSYSFAGVSESYISFKFWDMKIYIQNICLLPFLQNKNKTTMKSKVLKLENENYVGTNYIFSQWIKIK